MHDICGGCGKCRASVSMHAYVRRRRQAARRITNCCAKLDVVRPSPLTCGCLAELAASSRGNGGKRRRVGRGAFGQGGRGGCVHLPAIYMFCGAL